MVDYLMALHLHNVMAATQLEELVSFNSSVAVPAICRISAFWTSVECSCFLHCHLLCPVTRGLKPSRSVESDCWNSIWYPPYIHLQALQAHPWDLEVPVAPSLHQSPPSDRKTNSFQKFLHRQNVRVAVLSQQCKGYAVLHTGRWTRTRLEGKAGTSMGININIVC